MQGDYQGAGEPAFSTRAAGFGFRRNLCYHGIDGSREDAVERIKSSMLVSTCSDSSSAISVDLASSAVS